MRLRPLGVIDALDETFAIYRRYIVSFVLTMAVCVVPTTALSHVLMSLAVDPGAPGASSLATTIGSVALGFVQFAYETLLYGLASVAATHLASDAVLGRPLDIRAAYVAALRRVRPIALVYFVTIASFTLLFITCIGIPFAMYVLAGWSVAVPVLAIERTGGRDALRRSWGLVDGHRWRVIGVLAVVLLIDMLAAFVPSGLIGGVASWGAGYFGEDPAIARSVEVINVVVSAVTQSLFWSIGSIAATVVYYDLRVRREALDLERRVSILASEDIGGSRPTSPPGSEAGPG